jgi:hypothetical protein
VAGSRNEVLPEAFVRGCENDEAVMRSILLFAIGVPVPVILLLAFCTHHL